MEPTDIISDDVRLYRGDCLAVLPHLSGIDAVIADPPYGMDWNPDTTRFTGGHNPELRGPGRNDDKRIAGDKEPFDPTPFLAFRRVVLWGFHHFASRLPVGSALVWIKRRDASFGTFLSDAELAWMKGGYGVYCRRDISNNLSANDRLHPTQKPVGLMRWCLERAKVPAGGTVLDPYMGSGTVGLACMQMGLKYVGVELDPTHYETARRRLVAATGGGPNQLFAGVT